MGIIIANNMLEIDNCSGFFISKVDDEINALLNRCVAAQCLEYSPKELEEWANKLANDVKDAGD